MSAGKFYVCDTCGHIEARDAVPEDGEWTCGHAAWEFAAEKRAYAENHAAHIRRGIGKGGIFKHAAMRR